MFFMLFKGTNQEDEEKAKQNLFNYNFKLWNPVGKIDIEKARKECVQLEE